MTAPCFRAPGPTPTTCVAPNGSSVATSTFLARLEQTRSSGVTVSPDGKSLSAPIPPPPAPSQAVTQAQEQADALERDRKKLVDLQAEYARTATAMQLPQAQRELALVAMRAEDEALKLNLGTQGAAELKALRLSEAKIKLSATTRDSIANLMREAQATDLLTQAIGKGYDAKVAAQKQAFIATETRKNPFADRNAMGNAYDAKAESDRRNREATAFHDLDRHIDAERRLADARMLGAEAARQEGIASEAARRHEDEGLNETSLRIKLQSLDAERQRQELLSKAKSLNPVLTYQEEIAALDRLRQSKEGALVTEEQYSKAYEDAALRRLSAETDWVSGAERALISYRRSIEDSASAMEQGLTRSLKATEDAFVKWATTGKAAASDLFNTIAEEALRAAYRMAIAQPLTGLLQGMMSSLGGLFSGGGSSSSPPVGDFSTASTSVMVAHSGGVLGADSLERRSVDPGLFSSAQRFHTGGLPGLGPDEVPIIAQVGEEVLRQDDPRHRANLSRGNAGGAPVVIVQPTITNSVPGTQARTETRSGPNGEVMIDVFVEQVEARLGRNISRGTGLAAVLEPRYGLNPAAGAYR